MRRHSMKKEEKFTELLSKPELTEQLKACRAADKIRDLAKENGIEMTREEALQAFAFFSSGELQDDELNSVAGGLPPITPPPPSDPGC